jgi:ribose-phosphate pyrophosphokinase
MELLIMADAARRASAKRITAVMPFFAYARQDRKDRSRVPISAKLVANLLVAAGVNRVLTVDLHSPQIQGFFYIPVDHLYAAPLMVRYLREKLPADHRVVVAPDPGGLKMAYSYSQLLGAGLALAGKHRTSATEVEAIELVGDVKGKDCILTDDMTTTAGTLCSAAKLAKEHGAGPCAPWSPLPDHPAGHPAPARLGHRGTHPPPTPSRPSRAGKASRSPC